MADMSKEERIRLEALKLANFSAVAESQVDRIVQRAKKFEDFITTGETNADATRTSDSGN